MTLTKFVNLNCWNNKLMSYIQKFDFKFEWMNNNLATLIKRWNRKLKVIIRQRLTFVFVRENTLIKMLFYFDWTLATLAGRIWMLKIKNWNTWKLLLKIKTMNSKKNVKKKTWNLTEPLKFYDDGGSFTFPSQANFAQNSKTIQTSTTTTTTKTMNIVF